MYKLCNGWLAQFNQTWIQHPDLEGQRLITVCTLIRPYESLPFSGVAIWNPKDEYSGSKAYKVAFARALNAMLPYIACETKYDKYTFKRVRRKMWESMLYHLENTKGIDLP